MEHYSNSKIHQTYNLKGMQINLKSLFQDHIRLQVTETGDKNLKETNEKLDHVYSFPWKAIQSNAWIENMKQPSKSGLSVLSLQLLFIWERMLKQNGISVIENTTRLEQKSGVTEMCPFSLKTGTCTKSRKEAYIEEEISGRMICRWHLSHWEILTNGVAETDLLPSTLHF